jgi:5,5'-dehydrodivanillate O-demethylase
MLTQEDNDLLTRVGPGTPCGELLRRYWMPCALVSDLTPDQPTKLVRLLGEDLVIFRDKSGRLGMLADHCSHRGASLLYGRVEERGIACAYHGWLYDTEGYCLETPAEPADSKFHLTVRQRAYPVREYVGLIWAYLGPPPAPEIPPYDVWARPDGTRTLTVHPVLDCNWLQPMENSVDPVHSHFLHRDLISLEAASGSPGQFDFREVWFGIMKKRVDRGRGEEHPLIFPNILRQANATQIRVPVDDTHTLVYRVNFRRTRAEDSAESGIAVDYRPAYKEPAGELHPACRFDTMLEVASQDHMAWETQGPIANRTIERLATSDRGVVMFREMLKEEIAKMQRGLDPRGVIRDPNHEIIDTNLEDTFAYGLARRGE